MLIRRTRMFDPGEQTGGSPAPEGGEPSSQGGEPPANEPANEPQNNGADDVDSLPPWAQKTIKGLRKENAGHRTRANALEERLNKLEGGLKGLFGEEDPVPPEQALEQMQGTLHQVAMQNEILTLAIENNIPAEGIDYFQYLLGNAVSKLQEGEELDEDAIKGIVAEAKSKGSNLPGGAGGTTSPQSNSSPGKGNAPGEVTYEEFIRMGNDKQIELYRTNPHKYEELMREHKRNVRRRR